MRGSPHPRGTGRGGHQGRTRPLRSQQHWQLPAQGLRQTQQGQHWAQSPRTSPGQASATRHQDPVRNPAPTTADLLCFYSIPNHPLFSGALTCSFSFPLCHGSQTKTRRGSWLHQPHGWSAAQWSETKLTIKRFPIKSSDFQFFCEDLGDVGVPDPRAWAEGG